ncbi:MAG TPA: DUF5777 family beta-barrel protein [Cyclobacteriaceae bacterium]|nr:DUF5777 family beta-barrel protein [Cyclobacteriaceae bacterium]
MKKILVLLLISNISLAQSALLNELEQTEAKPETVSATFKGSRLVNGQTIETRHKGELEFIFAHRFGAVNGGAYELFGLDQAFVRIGLEYGFTDKLSAGFGRNSVDKTMDAYLRYKLISQKQNGMPVTITVFTNAAVRVSPRKADATYDITLEDRMSYTTQFLIARKFTPALSLQVMPTLVHRNTVDQSREKNDQFALGFGGRLKVSRSVSLNSEYYYRLGVPAANQYYNALGFGIDIETGGHVFQLVLTNTRGLTERAFLTETGGNFFDGDIHLGFNVTRSFQVKKK